ncbi:MAG: molybdate ABC transporter substrate-binding protein [Roseibium sp.]|nr:molybdate ABC transporter substrate-binding protein [Roseibium sp.]
MAWRQAGARFLSRFAAAIIGLSVLLCAPARAADLTVFAAASLKNAMDEIAAAFQSETGQAVTVSYAGSSALARQIEQGAPADVFVSASIDWMDHLDRQGLIESKSRFDIAGNRLVLIAHGIGNPARPIGPELDLAGLLEGGRLAMALVDAVPAGLYGKAALTSLGLWDGVQASVAQTDNVRAALALVATGEAPLGIVYRTDAGADDGVTVIGTFPDGSHPPIVYPAAKASASDNHVAETFLTFLQQPAARAVLTRNGFLVPQE